MVNPLRLREMVSLASFEEGRGRVSMNICRYYRSDYIAFSMIRTFLLTTVGLLIAAALFAAANAEELLDALVYMDIPAVLRQAAAVYLLILSAYLALTFVLAGRRYKEAERQMNDYELHLADLRDLTEVPYSEDTGDDDDFWRT